MINLPQVTLVAMTGKDIPGHYKALKESSRGITWGKVLLLSPENDSISWGNRTDETEFGHLTIMNRQVEPINSIDDWNYKIIYELPKYIETKFAMLIHADGYVIHPELWNPDWLNYDYVGAPWPLPQDECSYRDEEGGIQRVGNSVSLRSKSLMNAIAKQPEEKFWAIKEKFGNCNEDGWVCCHNRKWLERVGYKFPSLETAKHFSKEHEIPENVGLETFAFHSL